MQGEAGISYCVFKLKHDIRVESKIELARRETEILIGSWINELASLPTLFKTSPFNQLSDEVVHRITRLPYLGKTQGFFCENPSTDKLFYVMKRATYFREFYLVTNSEDRFKSLLSRITNNDFNPHLGLNDLNPNIQLYLQERPFLATFVFIPTQTLLELGSEVVKLPQVTFTKQFTRIEERLTVMERGVNHALHAFFQHILHEHSRQPWLGLFKEHIGDYVDWAFSDFRTWGLHFIHHHEGKADPWLARSCLNLLGVEEGGTVLDPFCGSGSFIADGPLLGVNVVGVDINPLSTLIARIKSQAYTLPIEEVKKALIKLDSRLNSTMMMHSDPFPEELSLLRMEGLERIRPTIKRILQIRQAIDEIAEIPQVRDFLYVILSRQITAIAPKKPIRQDPLVGFFKDAIEFYLLTYIAQRVLELLGFKPTADVKIFTHDARQIESIVRRVDGVVTSPPYFDALDYVRASSLSAMLLNLVNDLKELEKTTIGSTERMVPLEYVNELPESAKLLIGELVRSGRQKKSQIVLAYLLDIKKCLKELQKILADGGKCIFVVGKYHHWILGGETYEVDGAQILIDIGEQVGLPLEAELTHNISKIEAGNRIKVESIIIWRKGAERSARNQTRSAKVFRRYVRS
jgi:DNA modification methylase